MKSLLALLVVGFIASINVPNAAATGRVVVQRQRVVVQRVAVPRQRVVVQQQFAVPHVQQFIQPQAFIAPQQFIVPSYGVQQFVAPQQFNAGCSQQLNGSCQQFFRR